MIVRAFLCLLSAVGLAAAEEPLRWPPQETASRDSSLVAFKAALEAAIEARDAEAVAALASEEITLSFGGDFGRETLVRGLNDECENVCYIGGPGYWSELETALELGGMHSPSDPSVYVSPYTFWMPSPSEEYEGYDILAPSAPDTPLYAGPDQEGPVVTVLQYDVLVILDEPNRAWFKVKNSLGVTGYVRADDVLRPVGPRVLLEKGEGGQWEMSAFVAGD